LLGLDRNAARYVWTAVFVLFAVYLLYLIRDTLFIFVVALLFAYLLWPLVNLLDRHLPGRSRTLALPFVYLALVGALIAIGIVVGSRVVQDANALAARLPDVLARIHPPLSSAASPTALKPNPLLLAVEQQIANHSQELVALLPRAALGVIARAGNVIFVVLVPILSFFILKDGREMRDSILGLLAGSARRDTVERIATDLHRLLAQYMRALVLLGLVASVAYGICFGLMGVPYAALLAAVAFPLEFIPLVGPVTGGAIVLLVAGLSGSHHLLAILVFLIAFRIFQDYVVSPQLLSAGMKLHPLLVMFGVLAGASVAGIAGSFLSVPVLATLRIVFRQLLAKPAAVREIAAAGRPPAEGVS
jgi:predicted PurR-regulated permease PerM